MNYFDAECIRQDFLVAMHYGEIAGKERIESLNETAKKYTGELLIEAYKTISKKMDEERDALKALFLLAVQAKKL
jgi:hypothetical protein